MPYCNEDLMDIYRIIGIVVLISKIAVPLLIIVFGTFDIFHSVIKPKDEKSKNKIKLFIKRIIAGLIILFMPNIILTIFERVGLDKTEYSCSYNCVLDISNCE